MIPLALSRGIGDTRLTRSYRLVLVFLHGELNYDRYTPVKVSSVSMGISLSRPEAFRALATLEQLGYIEADPTIRKPKQYRLRNPSSLTHTTSRAA